MFPPLKSQMSSLQALRNSRNHELGFRQNVFRQFVCVFDKLRDALFDLFRHLRIEVLDAALPSLLKFSARRRRRLDSACLHLLSRV